MIKGIGHAAFVAKDMEKTLNFYCHVLGFKKLFELRHPQTNEPWIEYVKVRDGQFIEFFYGGSNSAESNHQMAGYSHLCLEVDDIHKIAEHVKSHGIALDVEPKQGLDLNYQCWVRDPDGNRIEFMQMNPKSPQMSLD